MQDKYAALRTRRLSKEQSMLVCAHNVMVDIVADNRVKTLVREVRLVGVAMDKGAPFADAFGRSIFKLPRSHAW